MTRGYATYNHPEASLPCNQDFVGDSGELYRQLLGANDRKSYSYATWLAKVSPMVLDNREEFCTLPIAVCRHSDRDLVTNNDRRFEQIGSVCLFVVADEPVAADGKHEAAMDESRENQVNHSPLYSILENPSASRIFQRGAAALQLLYESYNYAVELGRSKWDFAITISELKKLGITVSDCRWLLCKGLVEQGSEVSGFGETTRTFQKAGGLVFGKRTCFVLTESGLDVLRQFSESGQLTEPINGQAARERPTDESDDTNGTVKPIWDRDRQELRLGGRLIKRFKVPAPNQEFILAVFEEEGWPVRIDDPLPPHPDVDPKRRLHDTISSLNRNQKSRLLRFQGDGSGQGILWQSVEHGDEAY